MQEEKRRCKNCGSVFDIVSEDFLFYDKIKVPPPTWCPECRRRRRLSWRNDFFFYNRNCDLCKKSIISIYAPNSPRKKVYCTKCWWSDKWNPKEYAKDVDFSRPFLAQFYELQNKVPALALINDDSIASVNCEYTQGFAFGKNCYMTFVAWRVEDCLYSGYMTLSKQIVDSMTVGEHSELIYDSILVGSSYRCRNIHYASSLTDCYFCFDCRDCSDCLLSIGLRHKKYCIKNQQYSKEEYEKMMASYRLDTYSGVTRVKEEFKFLLLQYPHRFSRIKKSVNVVGDDLANCKNMNYSFNVLGGEDCRYYESGDSPKDCYDISVGGECNQCYESITPDQSYRALFTIYSWKSMEVNYCENCHSSKYLFGCVGLRQAQYCILNKQYSKEEYEILKSKIVSHMEETGEWGEFLPSSLSPFGYNETVAQIYFPLAKGDVTANGFNWQDYTQITVGRETIKTPEIPDSILSVPDSIINEVFICFSCKRNYLITPRELSFYKTMRIPLPRLCFYCRNQERFNFRNPFKLWHRKCTCGGLTSDNSIYQNTATHFHNQDHCPNEFETSYAPERPEIVYCETCYQSEVV